MAEDKNFNRAFTLIELTMVIIVIGLLLGGITVGYQVVKQSRVSALLVDAQTFNSNLISFRDKYGSYPGDIMNATTIWASLPSGFSATANGNGNGLIEGNTAGSTPLEDTYVMQHLALGDYLPNSYSAGGVIGTRFTLGRNSFRSSMPGSTIYANYQTAIFGDSGNMVQIGSYINNCAAQGIPNGGIVSAIEAYSMDNKIDDGLADQGLFKSGRACNLTATSTCVTNDVASATGSYSMTDTKPTCRMFLFIER